MKVLNKISDIFASFSKGCSCLALLCMILLICTDVALRFLVNSSIVGAYDMDQMIVSILVFASFVITQRDRELIHATFLVGKIPGKIKYVVWSIGHVIATLVCFGMALGAFKHGGQMVASKGMTATIGIPLYPFYYAASLFLFMFCFVLFVETIKTVLAFFNEDYAEQMRDQWTA